MDTFFKDFLTEISPALQNLLVLVALFVIGQLSEFIAQKRNELKAKMSVNQQVILDIVSARAVQTVEQLYKSEANQVKLDTALELAETALTKAGFNIDLHVVEDAIEAQVFKKNAALPQG